jgi:hypothetical protein
MLSVANKLYMLSVIMLSVIMLSVIMLSVIMLSVVAPIPPPNKIFLVFFINISHKFSKKQFLAWSQ